MFICSVRASTLRFFGLVLIAAAVLVGALAYRYNTTVEAASYQFNKIKTDEDRVEFLAQFGWEIDKTPIEQTEFTIPDTFDRVMMGYNEIQKSQGLDLSRYENKKVTRYTYEVKNYSGYEGKVYANVIVYRDEVIAGDICAADPLGFVHGFEKEHS